MASKGTRSRCEKDEVGVKEPIFACCVASIVYSADGLCRKAAADSHKLSGCIVVRVSACPNYVDESVESVEVANRCRTGVIGRSHVLLETFHEWNEAFRGSLQAPGTLRKRETPPKAHSRPGHRIWLTNRRVPDSTALQHDDTLTKEPYGVLGKDCVATS